MSTRKQSPGCIFCQIVAGRAPKAVVYEDSDHLAFLSIFPFTELNTVVIPKDHHPSDFSQVDPVVVGRLLQVAGAIVGRLRAADDRISRCVQYFEGLEVPHLHANLLPLRTTDTAGWRAWRPTSQPLSIAELEPLATKVRQAGQ